MSGRWPRIGTPWVTGAGGGNDPVFGGLGTITSLGPVDATSVSSTLANVAVGDLVVAIVQKGDQPTACTGVSFSGQALTKIKGVSEYGFGCDVWACIATSAVASAVITATYSNDEPWGSMISARWSNVGSITPLASSCTRADCTFVAADSNTRTALEITTSARSLILAVGTDYNEYCSHTAANGFTKRADGSGTPVNSIQFIFDRVADAGTFGGAANFSTTSPDDSYMAMLIAFPIA